MRDLIRTTVIVLTVLLLCAGFATTGHADTGFYVGGEVGRSTFDGTEEVPAGPDDPITGVDFAWYALGGFQIIDWLGVEAGYVDFGKGHDFDDPQEDFELSGTVLSAVGYIPVVPRVRIMIRAGAYAWELTETDSRGDEEADGTDLILGVGTKVHILGGFDARAEYIFMSDIGESGGRKPGEVDVTGLLAGITYTF